MTWQRVYPKAVVHDMHVTNPAYRPSWAGGKPVLIVNHFTVSCGAEWPATGRFASEGIGPSFGIRRDGTVCQYVDLDRSTWHARDCSHYGPGIEFEANPTAHCPILDVQLEAGAELNAWLCKTFGIPAVRSPGIRYAPGIKCHTDGLEDGGAKWDSAIHWDSPWQAAGDPIDAWISRSLAAALNTSPWSSKRFVGRIAEILNPPPPPPPPGGDMDDQEHAATHAVAKPGDVTRRSLWSLGFADGCNGWLNPAHAADPDYVKGHDAGAKVKALP